MALTYDGSFEATVAVNDSVVGTISRNVSLDTYTEAAETVVDYQLLDCLKAENTIKITQLSGANLRLDYLSFRLNTPKPMPDLETASFPEPEYLYHITNQDTALQI